MTFFSKGAFVVSLLLFLGFSLGIGRLTAQVTVSVVDESGNPLPGAHVSYLHLNEKKEQTILTNLSGEVTIPATKNATDAPLVLKVSFIGYRAQTDTVRSVKPVTFHMMVDEVTLNNLVITGEYAPNNPEKSVNKVKIIDRKQLDAMGAVNLSDALRYETNIRISQDNVLGSRTSVQGISGQNVKIMIDGVPVVGRQDGSIDLNQLNLNNIERIEVIEGPLSVKYGSNALAGTINLITKKDLKHKFEAGVKSYYESVGQYNLDGNLGYQKGRHYIGITGGRNFFDGWSPDDRQFELPKSKLADSSRNLQWNPKEQLFAGIQYRYATKHLTVRPFADVFHESIVNRGLPRSPYYDKAFDEYFVTKRRNAGLDLSGDFNKKVSWSVLASYNHYQRTKNTYFKDLTDLSQELTNNPEDQDTTIFHNWMSRGSVVIGRKAQKLAVEIGYDLNHETALGKRIVNGEQEIGDYALFTSAEWKPLETIVIKPGLRYSYNTVYEAPLIPSLNLRYARKNTTFRASYAKGFRAPGLKELYFEFVDVNHNILGNDNLKAETSDNFQVEISQKRIKDQTLTKADISVFYNKISNLITLAQQNFSTSYGYVNIGKFTTQGVQVGLSHAYNHLHVSIGLAYTGRSNQFNDTTDSGEMKYSPELRTNIMYEFKKWKGNVALFCKYNGRLQSYGLDDAGTVSETVITDYTMADLTFTKYLYKKHVNWSMGVKNILDVQNIGSSGFSGGVHNGSAGNVPVSWGRTIFTSLKIDLTWK